MELKQLEVFVCVAKTLNFSKAAEEMYISQPGVSTHISSLEKTLGTQLLIRNTKGVSLTKSGTQFLAYAHKILALKKQALHDMGSANRDVEGVIDIISSTIPVQHLLPEIISSFQKQWPNTIFNIKQAASGEALRAMSDFRYDFAMVGTSPDDENGFNHRLIYNDELVLVCSNDTREESDYIRENFGEFLRKTPFIMRETGSGTRREIETILLKIGIDMANLQVPAYLPDSHSILLAVSHGMGVSLISKVAADMYVDAGLVKMVQMHSPLFRRQIFLLYNKALWLSPVQQAFCNHAERFYSSSSGV
jgi:DNA-binding transcriptional LysR family regulator